MGLPYAPEWRKAVGPSGRVADLSGRFRTLNSPCRTEPAEGGVVRPFSASVRISGLIHDFLYVESDEFAFHPLAHTRVSVVNAAA